MNKLSAMNTTLNSFTSDVNILYPNIMTEFSIDLQLQGL